MTTPAIHETITRSSTVTPYQVFDDGLGNITQSSLGVHVWNTSIFHHDRPASVSTPPTRGSPRTPTNWSHSRRNMIANLGAIVFHRPRSPTAPLGVPYKVGEVWQDGSFWNSVPEVDVQSVPSYLRSKAELNALLKLQNQHIHIGNFLAELGQTAGMFVSLASTIGNSVRGYRRAVGNSIWQKIRKNEGSPNWRDVPDGWLQLQYGWKPGMSDLRGAIQQLGDPQRPQIIGVKGNSHDEGTYTVQRGGGHSSTQVGTFRTKWQVQVGLHYQLVSPLLATLSQLGLLNPVEIAWEKSRYSFVVDWLIPVSSWLQSLTADAGWGFLNGYRSTISRVSRDSFIESVRDPDGVLVSSGNSAWSLSGTDSSFNCSNTFAFVRSVYLSSPVPGLYVKSPFSSGHVANAMSLVIQAFK